MSTAKTTPMIKQYLGIKEKHPDAILFYRMGDFYEMFFEDAEVASGVLEIALTSRNKKDKTPIPMCGVPARAAQSYIVRLLENGFKVAICDQVEDPNEAKGLVKREVVRIITAGTIIEDELLDEKANNYIIALAVYGDTVGLASLDISTGYFRVTESAQWGDVKDEILRISPSEALLGDSLKTTPFYESASLALDDQAMTFLEDRAFELSRGRERLLDQFGTVTLEGFGCAHMNAGIRAAGGLLFYLKDTQKQAAAHINGIETYHLEHYLQIDDTSRRNLELTQNIRSGSRKGTLLAIIDRTVTAMGARMLVEWLKYPLLEIDEIDRRQEAVEEMMENRAVRENIREALKQVHDLERLGSKVTLGHCNARDLLALKHSLYALSGVWENLPQLQSSLFHFDEKIDPLKALADLIDAAIQDDAPPTLNEGGLIKKGFNVELDEIVRMSRDGKGWLARLETKEKAATGINALKVRYNKVFGYYLEVPKSRSSDVPPHYVRKQTLVNAERFITDELKKFELKVLSAEDRRTALEYELFLQIKESVVGHNPAIQRIARFLATIDCISGLAQIADLNDYCRPEINSKGAIEIHNGRHPVVEKMITGERYVPNSIAMDMDKNQILIITGPNMAGKSTVLRKVALFIILAQIGAFVPAEKASLSIVDKIFTRVGALDNLSQGQSTFMVEMEETAYILNHATEHSLVIMDEIGRGTSTFDGLSIAWAVAEHLHDLNGKGVKTLFATHYHELTDLAMTKTRVKNCNIAVKEWNDEIIFLRKLVDGGTNRSYGIQVARLAGIPVTVVDRAKKILANIENEEHGINGLPKLVENDKIEEMGHVQMGLFRKPENAVRQTLERLDISRMTPLEALNCLNDLKARIKSNR
jgi:DNA mismatch repair protein MutS